MADKTSQENGMMTNSKNRRSCSSCFCENSKYCCPRCKAFSCSLICVKKHKIRESCSGERDKAKFVPRNEYGANHLIQDYRFLEETKRVVDNAQRDKMSNARFHSKNVRKLRNAAAKHDVQLKLMPVGLKKRMENTSCHHYRTNTIMWRVRWEFPQANTHCIDDKAPESQSLECLLEKYLHAQKADPVMRQKLKSYCSEEIGVFIRNHSSHHPRFYQVDISLTLREALAGKVVIEYPTFHVVLSRCFSEYSTTTPSQVAKQQKLPAQIDNETNSTIEIDEN